MKTPREEHRKAGDSPSLHIPKKVPSVIPTLGRQKQIDQKCKGSLG